MRNRQIGIRDRWRLRKLRGPDLVFYAALYRGVAPLQAFRMSDESRQKATSDQLRLAVQRLLERHRDLFGPLLDKEARHESLSAMAEAAVEEQLRSKEWKERSEGVKHARAICGMDAPTKTHAVIESPHLVKEPVDWIPAAERFKPQPAEQN